MRICLKIPESWNQLNINQLTKIANILHSKESTVFFDFKIFIALLNIKYWQLFKKWKAFIIFKNIPLSTIKENYKWLYLDCNLTKFIPNLKIKSKILKAPADRLNNLTIDEFSKADDLYLGWIKTQNFEYLEYLTAILYRELYRNNKRVAFDNNELEKRAEDLSKINRKILLAILLSYQGSRNYIISEFPIVFPKPKANKKLPKNSGFEKLILHLSGEKFGAYNETKNTNVYTFLRNFEEQLKNPKNA